MTLQSDLRERVAARSVDAADPAAEAAELAHKIRRGRRRRSLVAAAASGLCLGVVAYVAFGLVQGRDDAPPAEQPSVRSGVAVLGDVGEGDVVVAVRSNTREANAVIGPERILVISPERGVVGTVSGTEVREALGSSVEDWPSVSLVGVVTAQGDAVFRLDSPTAYVTPMVAVYSVRTGSTVVMDPCESTLQRVDLSPWCPDVVEGPVIVDPANGADVRVPGYEYCVGATVRTGLELMASCENEAGEATLVTIDPATGAIVGELALGLGGMRAPWVLDGIGYANLTTVEGDPVLVATNGVNMTVGGGAVAGLGVVDGRLLVQTSSDAYGGESSYGRVLGLLDPATGDFAVIAGSELERGDRVSVVEVVR